MNNNERNILIVDDDSQILELIGEILHEESFTNLFFAKSQAQALDIFNENKIDLCILDILLPDGSGFDIIKKIREKKNTPVLFLSAISDIEKQYNGFLLGADDYMVKPFQARELVLRIKAILNRAYPEGQEVDLAHCKINFSNALVLKNDEEIPLTAKEYHILKLLYENKNNVVTINNILLAVWGSDAFGYENTLMAHIRKIRKKIEKNPSTPENLITFKGLGYKLKV